MTPTPTPITSEECRRLIGVSLATLSRLVKAGAIPFYRVGTGPKAGVRFQREAILAWMARGGVRRGKVHVTQNGNEKADSSAP
jgi:excisionase family DNA binding protein